MLKLAIRHQEARVVLGVRVLPVYQPLVLGMVEELLVDTDYRLKRVQTFRRAAVGVS